MSMEPEQMIKLGFIHFAINASLGLEFFVFKQIWKSWVLIVLLNVFQAFVIFYAHMIISVIFCGDHAERNRHKTWIYVVSVVKVILHIVALVCGFVFFGSQCYIDYGDSDCGWKVKTESWLSADFIQTLILAAVHNAIELSFGLIVCGCESNSDYKYQPLRSPV